MTPRQPGAQPGNLNALKHGFYSRRFSDMERLDLEALMEDGLDSEIAMLRVATRRVFDLANGVESLEQASELLGTLSMAAGKLSGMLRVRALLGTEQPDEFLTIISEAIDEALVIMRKKCAKVAKQPPRSPQIVQSLPTATRSQV